MIVKMMILKDFLALPYSLFCYVLYTDYMYIIAAQQLNFDKSPFFRGVFRFLQEVPLFLL